MPIESDVTNEIVAASPSSNAPNLVKASRSSKTRQRKSKNERILGSIFPHFWWPYCARADVRQLLAKEIIAVKRQFKPSEIADFCDTYLGLQACYIDNLGGLPKPFMTKASGLDTSHAFALKLLIMDQVHVNGAQPDELLPPAPTAGPTELYPGDPDIPF